MQQVKLTHGIIHRVEVGFPSGCAGLVHIQIKEGLHQRWPSNPEGSFNSDGYTIGFDEHLKFYEEPYILTLVGWNLDDTYDHIIEVRFGILPPEVLISERSITLSVRTIAEELVF